MPTIKRPIWQDVYYTSTAYTMLEYVINRSDRTVIYAGRAYQRPGGNGISINISKICQDYIKDSFSEVDFRTLTGTTYSHPDAYVEFELRERDSGTLLNTYGFVYDWSYEEWTGQTRTVSNPINGDNVTGMYSFNTTFTSADTVSTAIGKIATGNCCGEVALYYKNRKGGWDSFLIEGTVTKKDTYTKYIYNRSFNNNTLEFENGTYHSQIVTSYVLNTGWLNDQQSDNLAFNLLSSNEVYLHNLISDKVYPVVITDNTATYKTYKNNSRKLVNYQINVEESQRKEVL